MSNIFEQLAPLAETKNSKPLLLNLLKRDSSSPASLMRRSSLSLYMIFL